MNFIIHDGIERNPNYPTQQRTTEILLDSYEDKIDDLYPNVKISEYNNVLCCNEAWSYKMLG